MSSANARLGQKTNVFSQSKRKHVGLCLFLYKEYQCRTIGKILAEAREILLLLNYWSHKQNENVQVKKTQHQPPHLKKWTGQILKGRDVALWS